MRTTLCSFGLAAVLAAPSLAAADELVSRPFVRGPHSCGTIQEPLFAPSSARVLEGPAGVQRVIYLNRTGGTYMATTSTNSSANTVNRQIIRSGAGSFTIPPLDTSFNWPMIVSCVKQHFTAINVRFVESEPTSGMYLEASVGGDGSEIGFPAGSGLLGIASADMFCRVTETGVAFSFAEAHFGGSRDLELCTTISHEVGHLLSLEHETLATDLMSYVPVTQAPSKAFVNQFSACGTHPSQPQSCSCGAQQQNSFDKLSTFVGAKPVEAVKPTLTVEAPGASSAPTFDVIASASDDRAMADVRVIINGTEYGNTSTLVEGKYKITVRNVPLGMQQVTVIARDEAGNETSQTVVTTVAKLGFGETCVANDACEGNLCATGEEGNFCTQSCDLAMNNCPDDSACTAVNGGNICVPEPTTCGCTARTPGEGLGILLLVGIAGVLGLRRRRR